MKEDIRTVKSSDERKKIKTTELWAKIMEMHKIKKRIFFYV